MKHLLILLLISPLAFSGCKKCVECEVRLKQSQTIIGTVDEFCGNDTKIEAEENRLRTDHTCIECTVNLPTGPNSTGILCGDRAFTDQVQSDSEAGAAAIGTTSNCVFYRDTANVSCTLKP